MKAGYSVGASAIGDHLRKLAGVDGFTRYNRIRSLASAIAKVWRTMAPNRRYLKAIKLHRTGKFEFEIALRGTYPNLIEHGMGPDGVGSAGPYNLSELLLRGGKISKSGVTYRVVNIPGVGFRVTSSNKPPWRHPGIPARRIAYRVQSEVARLIRELDW